MSIIELVIKNMDLLIHEYPEFVITICNMYVIENGKKEQVVLNIHYNYCEWNIIERDFANGKITVSEYIRCLLNQGNSISGNNWSSYIIPFLTYLQRIKNGSKYFYLFVKTGKALRNGSLTDKMKRNLLSKSQKVYLEYMTELRKSFLERIKLLYDEYKKMKLIR